MRRLARRVFTMCSALSPLLCVAVCVLWVRSYWVSDSFIWSRHPRGMFVVSADGEFRLEHTRAVDDFGANLPGGFKHRTERADGSGAYPDRIPGEWLHFQRWGFVFVTGVRWDTYHHAVFLPAWFLVALLVALPAVKVGGVVRRLRGASAGRCPSCGYDLRASPERCPEQIEGGQVALTPLPAVQCSTVWLSGVRGGSCFHPHDLIWVVKLHRADLRGQICRRVRPFGQVPPGFAQFGDFGFRQDATVHPQRIVFLGEAREDLIEAGACKDHEDHSWITDGHSLAGPAPTSLRSRGPFRRAGPVQCWVSSRPGSPSTSGSRGGEN